MTLDFQCFRTLGTHRASLVTVHSEVRAEEEVSDGQEERFGQWSSSVIIIQLICLGGRDISIRLN